ncbi:MAG: FliG C-terminal domain-containing protein, partial [Thermomonas sp.]
HPAELAHLVTLEPRNLTLQPGSWAASWQAVVEVAAVADSVAQPGGWQLLHVVAEVSTTDPVYGSVPVQQLFSPSERVNVTVEFAPTEARAHAVKLPIRVASNPQVRSLALRGADPKVKDKIINNMSQRAAEMLVEDMEARGPVRLAEVEAAQKEILAIVRKMADDGSIQLAAKAEVFV